MTALDMLFPVFQLRILVVAMGTGVLFRGLGVGLKEVPHGPHGPKNLITTLMLTLYALPLMNLLLMGMQAG